MKSITRILSVFALTAVLAVTASLASRPRPAHVLDVPGPEGKHRNGVALVENGKSILRVSPDFKVPDTPAPTWRVVDSNGAIYTLDAFKIKGGEKREVEVPAYVHNIAKVQVYCAFAQVLLGEASFSSPVK